MARSFNPKSEALAYRLWSWAGAIDWNCTLMEAAEALDVSPHRLSGVAQGKGWLGRFRAGARELAFSVRMDGRRDVDGVAMIGMDGLEALGVHHAT